MSEWTVIDLTPATPATEPEPEAEPSVKVAMLKALSDIAMRRLGVDLTGEFTVDTDPDNGDARITMTGLTLGDGGDLVPSEREYEWTGNLTVTVQVSGTVTARSEDEADELALEALRDVEVRFVEVDGAEDSDWDLCDYDLDEVSEV